jgi:hypothetical protein
MLFSMMKTHLILVVMVCSLGLNVRAQDCMELANNIMKGNKAADKKAVNVIPKKLRMENAPDEDAVFHLHDDTAQTIFEKSRNNFLAAIKKKDENGDSLEDILRDLKKKETVKDLKKSDDKDALLENLKAIRKQAIILRSVFEVYSNEHVVPEQFELFTKKLGKLNDYLDFDAWKAIPDGAKKTYKALDIDEIENELAAFKASTPKATKKHLEEIKGHILDLTSKKELSVDEFHETRKLLKHFLAVAQLGKAQEDGKDLEASFKFLEEMNEKLGSLRDDVLEEEVKAVNAGKKLHDEETQEIPEHLKDDIKKFLQTFTIKIES